MLLCLCLLVSGDDSKLETVGKVDGVELQVAKSVSSGITITDFKLDGGRLICTVTYKSGPKDNVWINLYDKAGEHTGSHLLEASKLVKGEKSQIRFDRNRKEGKTAVIKITRNRG
jgi:hypothetical protein